VMVSSSTIFVCCGGHRITLQRRWLWLWLVIIVQPSCHAICLVATSLTVTWHLDVMPEQVALGKGGVFTHLVLLKKPSPQPFWLVWVGDVALPRSPQLVLILVDHCRVASTLEHVDGVVVVVRCCDGGQ
jgi:hypothetical protein